MTEKCSTCGKKPGLRPFSDGYSNHDIFVQVNEFKHVEGKGESRPQLIGLVQIYRNGGPEDPVCDDCILLGLLNVRDQINISIDSLNVSREVTLESKRLNGKPA